jgi:predicted DNA-binding protein
MANNDRGSKECVDEERIPVNSKCSPSPPRTIIPARSKPSPVEQDRIETNSTSLPESRFSRTLETMEVHFAPEMEKKLQDLAAQTGRGTADELVRDVVEGYFDELAKTREMLNSRYDDLKTGRVKPIPGDEVAAYFREKSAAARRAQQRG